MKQLIIVVFFFICKSAISQITFEFDSIKYNTYEHPAVYDIFLTKDSIKFIAIKTWWEAWITVDQYSGVTIKNGISDDKWRDIRSLSDSFINDTPTNESFTRTHSHKSKLEWYLGDSLVYFISFYPDSPRNSRLQELHNKIYGLTKIPNNQYWEAYEFCNDDFITGLDSIVLMKVPNKKELRKPYDIKAKERDEYVKTIKGADELYSFNEFVKNTKPVNPFKNNIYSNLYKKENYYSFDLYKDGKRLRSIFFYKNYLRTHRACWSKFKLKDILKDSQ